MELMDGIVSAWEFNQNSKDSTSLANGSDVGKMTYNFGNVVGKRCAVFNGTSYILVGELSDYAFIHNTGVFSVEFWCKFTTVAVTEYMMGNTPTSVEKGFYFGKTNTGSITFVISNGAGALILSFTRTSFFTDTNWHHVVVTGNYPKNTSQFYKDGIPFGIPQAFSNPPATGNQTRQLAVGTINWTTPLSLTMNGSLDRVRIWNKELSADEIYRLYNNRKGLDFPFVTNAFNGFPRGVQKESANGFPNMYDGNGFN